MDTSPYDSPRLLAIARAYGPRAWTIARAYDPRPRTRVLIRESPLRVMNNRRFHVHMEAYDPSNHTSSSLTIKIARTPGGQRGQDQHARYVHIETCDTLQSYEQYFDHENRPDKNQTPTPNPSLTIKTKKV